MSRGFRILCELRIRSESIQGAASHIDAATATNVRIHAATILVLPVNSFLLLSNLNIMSVLAFL